MKKKKYKIIHIKFPSKSFSHANGLYAIIKTNKKGDQHTYETCKIDEFGKPMTFEDGKLMTSITGINNPGITQTNLILTH